MYLLVMILLNQVSISIFRSVAAIFRAVVIANTAAFVYIACALLFSGYIIQEGVAFH